jgi:2-iminobutanoate/2-iminopropanoate deaminase
MPRTVLRNPGLVFKPLPFSPAVEANGIVWLSGQTGHAPGQTGPVPGGVEAQTRQALENIGITLRAIGLDYTDVVKVTVYLKGFEDFAGMNEAYREFFGEEFPARATVGVVRLNLDYAVEIDVIAAR